ncbi:thymidine phosphorylase [Candidatus Colwellia aromaticivorans]|uniref:thymidine phosphorylase n=1 Tax=Candidatus Colwellia aromaticivorans TaxID=2267621 RepID=UPI000DF1D394|nr:thymidine phosphorylase [Candidatus Colwellia aromaticivorans]
MMLPQEIIAKKCNGQILSESEIGLFVDGLTSTNFNDAQVGAMAMAIFLQGLNKQETVYLTSAMMKSGKVLSWGDVKNAEGLLLNGPIVDKHSTGGVGDKVSFMLAAIVAACGGYVPMISGRGLGHTGGTADKLESIAGFNVQPKLEQFKRIVANLGMAIISQTPELAPADRRLYAIRDVTATVASIPLITASILSKKLAAGLDVLVMDIKVGNGAMMTDLNQARALAQSITTVANDAGVNTQAIITDMNQVLGNTAGNALEIDETVKYLTGEFCEPRLHEVVVSLAKAMLLNSKLAADEDSANFQIDRALASGKAAEIFAKMISALGGPNDLLEKPWQSMNKAEVIIDVLAPCHGYISTMQTRDIGISVVGLGGGRMSNDQIIDHSVGFDRILSIGTHVNKGDILARVHASSKVSAELASNQYIKALKFSDVALAEPKIIYRF